MRLCDKCKSDNAVKTVRLRLQFDSQIQGAGTAADLCLGCVKELKAAIEGFIPQPAVEPIVWKPREKKAKKPEQEEKLDAADADAIKTE